MVLANQITAAMQGVLASQQGFVPLHEPRLDGNEKQYLMECIDTTFVSSVGKFVDNFEHMLAAKTGAGFAVATVNGTAALHLALIVSGVEKGDEVIVPALTFVATANAVSYCGAVNHFVDSDPDTFGLCPSALDKQLSQTVKMKDGKAFNKYSGRHISAVIAMHVFGHPCRIDEIVAVADRYGIRVIEDAAESLGSTYKGMHTGRFAPVSAISFNGNKTITTGGGGALLTDDAKLAVHAKHLSTTAKSPHRWDYVHDKIGYNYRMPNINAALGCAQLERLEEFVQSKRSLFERYYAAFADIAGVRLLAEPKDACSNYWLQTLVLETPALDLRNEVLRQLNDAGIMARPIWELMPRQPAFVDCQSGELPVAEMASLALINIPSSALLLDQ